MSMPMIETDRDRKKEKNLLSMAQAYANRTWLNMITVTHAKQKLTAKCQTVVRS